MTRTHPARPAAPRPVEARPLRTPLTVISALPLLAIIAFPLAAPATAFPLPAPGTAFPLAAQATASDTVVVGTRVVPPFVIEEPDGSYSGLTVHLWESIAHELDIDFRFEQMGIEEMLEGVADGTLYAAAAAHTITAEREALVDFSHPFFVTGLGIAVAERPTGFIQAARALFDPQLLWVIALLAGLLLFWGMLVWVFERKKNQEEFGGTTAEGIGNGFWWAAVTMTTVGYGDKAPRTLAGRIVGFVWMFCAIIVISFFTASIASSLTLTQLDTGIAGPRDLPNVRVGVMEASAPLAYLEGEGVRPATYAAVPDGLRALVEGEIDAFVHDAAILRHLTREGFAGEARVLPGSFNRQYYGIALPMDAPVRNRLNQALLEHLASEQWIRVKERYLGEGT